MASSLLRVALLPPLDVGRLRKLIVEQGQRLPVGEVTPLYVVYAVREAIRQDSLELMELLLEAGLQLNQENESLGGRVGWLVITGGSLAMVRLAVEAGLDVNLRGRTMPLTPFLMAAMSENGPLVELLLDTTQPDLSITAEGGVSVLTLVVSNCPSVTSRLLAAGADVNAESDAGSTALMAACGANELQVVEELLAAGARVNHADQAGQTALMCAAKSRQTPPSVAPLLRRLVEVGAELDAGDTRGLTALMHAVSDNHLEAVQALAELGADLGVRGEQEQTALCIAASLGRTQIVEMLIGGGACIDDRNVHGESPLHLAAKAGHVGTMRALLEHQNCNINAATENARTPLMCASSRGHVEAVELLLRRSANFMAVDSDGLTAATIASRAKKNDVVRALAAACDREAVRLVLVGLHVGQAGHLPNSLTRFAQHALFDINVLPLVAEFTTGKAAGVFLT